MKRFVAKPIREEDREYIERAKKQYEKNIKQMWKKIKRDRRRKIMKTYFLNALQSILRRFKFRR